MLFKLSNLNSNLALTLGYLNPALNNSALLFKQTLRLRLTILRVSKSCLFQTFTKSLSRLFAARLFS